jgi:hypothetical protein
MAKPAAEGLDPAFLAFLEWSRDNQGHANDRKLEQVGEEIGALRFVADVEAEPPWTNEQLDAVQAGYERALEQHPADTPLEMFV